MLGAGVMVQGARINEREGDRNILEDFLRRCIRDWL